MRFFSVFICEFTCLQNLSICEICLSFIFFHINFLCYFFLLLGIVRCSLIDIYLSFMHRYFSSAIIVFKHFDNIKNVWIYNNSKTIVLRKLTSKSSHKRKKELECVFHFLFIFRLPQRPGSSPWENSTVAARPLSSRGATSRLAGVALLRDSLTMMPFLAPCFDDVSFFLLSLFLFSFLAVCFPSFLFFSFSEFLLCYLIFFLVLLSLVNPLSCVVFLFHWFFFLVLLSFLFFIF